MSHHQDLSNFTEETERGFFYRGNRAMKPKKILHYTTILVKKKKQRIAEKSKHTRTTNKAEQRFKNHMYMQQRKNIRKKARLDRKIEERKKRREVYLQKVEKIRIRDQWTSSYNEVTGVVEDPEEREPMPEEENWDALLEVHTESEDFESSDDDFD